MLFKQGVLNKFEKFTGKNPCQSLFCDSVADSKIVSLSKKTLAFMFLSCHVRGLDQNLLKSTNINFDVITKAETRIHKNVSATQNIVLNNYSLEHTPTES